MTTIDSIVRGALFSKQLPIHYYVQFLHYALECINSELILHSMPSIRTVEIVVNEFSEAPMPANFVDWTKVGMRRGIHIVPLRQNKSFSRLPNFNSSGVQVSHDDANGDILALPLAYDGFWWTNYVNEYGEHIGRIFGGKTNDPFSFKVIRERNIIQLDPSWDKDKTLFLEYIFRGVASPDSQVHPYVELAVKAYIEWKFSDWAQRPFNEITRRHRAYLNEHRKARAAMSMMSKDDIVEISRRRFKQSIKV